MLSYPKVEIAAAQGFGKVWHHNGIGIILADSHYKFATDFANVVLRNFIDQTRADMEKEEREAAEKAKKKEIVLA
jgi:hypothetical protein